MGKTNSRQKSTNYHVCYHDGSQLPQQLTLKAVPDRVPKLAEKNAHARNGELKAFMQSLMPTQEASLNQC
jgi:hypothetical protein